MTSQGNSATSTCAAPSPDKPAPRGDWLHRLLLAQVAEAGCFRPTPARTWAHAAIVLSCYGAGYAALLADPGIAVRVLVVVALAFITVQAGALAHAAGHGAISRDRRAAALAGQLFHTLLGGLSYSYFQHIHRQHHPHCNDRDRDPDMQSDFVSLHRQSALAKTGLGWLISRHQAPLVWVLIGLQGFTLKLDGLRFLWCHPRATRVDQLVVSLHFALWLGLPALLLGVADALLNYGAMTLLVGFYVGAIFLVNHVGTQVIEPGESISFFMQETSVTRNLGASWWDDFIFIGVNNHIEHHLFPSMPTARLRHARRITRAFCARHGIPYQEMSWFAAAREVTRHLKEMSALVPR
jgi:fatty acid desaturase